MNIKMTQSGFAVHIVLPLEQAVGWSMQPSLSFPDEINLTPEIPPTWAPNSDVFHVTERCGRLHAIPNGNRITGKPHSKLRQCFNCEDIIRTKRRG